MQWDEQVLAAVLGGIAGHSPSLPVGANAQLDRI